MTVQSPAVVRLDLANSRLLAPNDLDTNLLGTTLSSLLGGDTDFADLFFEATTRESWRMEEQRVTSGGFSLSRGVGIRTIAGDRAALAYSSDLSPRALSATAESARDMQRRGVDASTKGGVVGFRREGSQLDLYTTQDVIGPVAPEDKIALLQEVDRRARAVDPRIRTVTASLRLSESTVLVTASDGTLAADVRPLVQLNVTVVAEQNGKISRGSAGLGGRYRLADITESYLVKMIDRAVTTALVNLHARPAPAGVMPVVLGRGFPGVLLHEAVGHGLEGDAHRSRSSVFVDRKDQPV